MSACSPTVSIIMTVYNRQHLVAETLNSIRQQTYEQWELMVIDDGSTDETARVIKGFNDPRISYCRMEHKGYNGSLYNPGLAATGGELVAFCDSDDLWHPRKLQKQVEVLNIFPGADFVMTGGYNFKETGLTHEFFYRRKSGYRYGHLFRAFFYSGLTAMLQTLLLKRTCLDIVKVFNEEPYSHIQFLLELARYYKGVIAYEPLVYRRLHENNNSASSWIQSHRDGLSLIRNYKFALPRQLYHDAIFRSHMHFAEKCLQYKIYRKAYPEILAAWGHKPLSIIPMKKLVKTGLAQVFKK